MGAAYGFIAPVFFISPNKVNTSTDVMYLLILQSGLTLVITILNILFFKDVPKDFVDKSFIIDENKTIKQKWSDFERDIKGLFNNPKFCLLFTSFSLIWGVWTMISTFLGTFL